MTQGYSFDAEGVRKIREVVRQVLGETSTTPPWRSRGKRGGKPSTITVLMAGTVNEASASAGDWVTVTPGDEYDDDDVQAKFDTLAGDDVLESGDTVIIGWFPLLRNQANDGNGAWRIIAWPCVSNEPTPTPPVYDHTGSLTATLGAVTLSSAGTNFDPDHEGTATITLGAVTLSSTGTNT